MYLKIDNCLWVKHRNPPQIKLKFELFKFQGTHIQVWGGKTTEGFTTSNHHEVDDV